MFMSLHQTTGQINYAKVANDSPEIVANFMCLEMTL
jgi:hypothetical protein